MSLTLRTGQPNADASTITGSPGFMPSTSTPKIGRVLLARY
jgi:hypothetical protein